MDYLSKTQGFCTFQSMKFAYIFWREEMLIEGLLIIKIGSNKIMNLDTSY